VIKDDRVFALLDQIFVDLIDHFQKGHVRTDPFGGVLLKAAFVLFILLTPDVQGQIHCSMG